MSHRRTVPSRQPDATLAPSGDNATRQTQFPCLPSTRLFADSFRSHSLTAPSNPPETIVRSSGPHATLLISLFLPCTGPSDPIRAPVSAAHSLIQPSLPPD